MRYLLDSNTCIGWLKQNQPKLLARIELEQPSNLFLCSSLCGELLYGVERSAVDISHRIDAESISCVRNWNLSPFDDAAAEVYGRIRSFLTSKARPSDQMICSSHRLRSRTISCS